MVLIRNGLVQHVDGLCSIVRFNPGYEIRLKGVISISDRRVSSAG